jgi:hypothetical protein
MWIESPSPDIWKAGVIRTRVNGNSKFIIKMHLLDIISLIYACRLIKPKIKIRNKPMRIPTLFLLALAAITPSVSRAEVVLNGTWSNDFNSTIAQSVAIITVTSGDWSVNSLSLDGLTINTGTYTPVASDFNVVLQSGGSILGSATATSVGSLVSIGNGFRSRFSATFANITNWNLTSGAYDLYIGTAVSPSGDLSSLTTRGPFGGSGTNGFSYTGPLAVTLDATQSGGGVVPEPSTYGLALGGLALAAVMIRRRTKRSVQA